MTNEITFWILVTFDSINPNDVFHTFSTGPSVNCRGDHAILRRTFWSQSSHHANVSILWIVFVTLLVTVLQNLTFLITKIISCRKDYKRNLPTFRLSLVWKNMKIYCSTYVLLCSFNHNRLTYNIKYVVKSHVRATFWCEITLMSYDLLCCSVTNPQDFIKYIALWEIFWRHYFSSSLS